MPYRQGGVLTKNHRLRKSIHNHAKVSVDRFPFWWLSDIYKSTSDCRVFGQPAAMIVVDDDRRSERTKETRNFVA